MKLHIKNVVSGKYATYDVKQSDTIKSVKQQITDKEKISREQQASQVLYTIHHASNKNSSNNIISHVTAIDVGSYSTTGGCV